MAEQNVTLGPGESQVATFEAIPGEAKTYNVTVDSLAGNFRAISAPPPIGLIGDLNDDGVIDSADLDILSLYIIGYPISQISPLSEVEFLGRADVNEDGVVNLLDISALEPLIEVPGAYFVSCEVPAQAALYEEFWASHRVWLTARADKLYDFELLINNKVIQLKQIFPVTSSGFYEAKGYALWGADETPISLRDIPLGTYNVISRCSVISCKIEQTPYGPTIRTWGSWEGLWKVDTGKTIEIVEAAPPPPPPPPAMIQITGFSVPSSAKAGTAVTAVVTYKVTGTILGATATLYATNEFVDALATSPVNLAPGTHTLTLTFTAWHGTILMNVYCYIKFATHELPEGWAYSGVKRITITNLVY